MKNSRTENRRGRWPRPAAAGFAAAAAAIALAATVTYQDVPPWGALSQSASEISFAQQSKSPPGP